MKKENRQYRLIPSFDDIMGEQKETPLKIPSFEEVMGEPASVKKKNLNILYYTKGKKDYQY